MKKIYTLFIPVLLLTSCSTRIQYVGNAYQPTTKMEVYVTESAIKKSYTIMGQGYIKPGRLGGDINWNKVQRTAIQKGKEHGADAVLIVQKRAVSTLPALASSNRIDSIGKGIQSNAYTETYYPVSVWHEILFLKYN